MKTPRFNLRDNRQLRLAWLAAAVLVVLGLVLGALSESSYRRQAERSARVQADIFSASVTAALAFGDVDVMREYIRALRANPRVAAAAVYDLQGRPVATFSRGGIRPPEAVGSPGTRRQAGAVLVTRRVAEGDLVLGSVYLATQPDAPGQFVTRHGGLALLTITAFGLMVGLTRAAAELQRYAAHLHETNLRLGVEIKERAKAEEALRQSQKMEALGQLTGGIAHDFNNLLQVIHGAFEMITRRVDDPERVTRYAENGRTASERAAALTRQLLAFSRAQKLELRPFVVADLLADSRELLMRSLGPEVRLAFDIRSGDAVVISDRTQLELAVLNLAINARDAMPDGGVLTISTQPVEVATGDPVLEPGDYVELSVADTGLGMDPQTQERAFDPFFTTKGVGQGTGLGLSQVYGVARQAGGAAFIRSAPGEGATVSLLLRRSDRLADAPAASDERAPWGAGASVWVVDDDEQVRRLVCDTLELLGYKVRSAASGEEALAMLARGAPDLLLLDFAMPGMTGAELASRARTLWPNVPIVFASGYADTAAVKGAVGDEAVILQKPFVVDELARVVGRALAGP